MKNKGGQRCLNTLEKVKFFSQALFWLGAAASVLLGLVIAHVTGTL